eukprot:6209254-Pleurochrysis_carterae.AAC.2
MNATSFLGVTATVALITRLKHAFEVPQLLHGPGLSSAMRTAQLSSNLRVKNGFSHLRYVSSTCVNSSESFSGCAEAREVTVVFIKLVVVSERYLEPASFASAPGSDCSSDTTSNDNVIPPTDTQEPGTESAYAEPMAAVGTPATPLHNMQAHAIARLK